MTPSKTANKFFSKFKALAPEAREIFISKVLAMRELREDMIDLAIAKKRLKGKFRPFEEVVEEILKKRKK